MAWSYDVADRNFDFIAAGETLTLTYIAVVDDHHGGVVSVPLTVTVTVHGTNDIPTITATSDAFIERAGTNNATSDHAGGTIVFADVDLTDRPTVATHFTSFTYQDALHNNVSLLTTQQQAAVASVEASLSLTPAGANANNGSVVWSYDLPDNSFDFLADGETLALTYTATVNDHHGGIVSTPITVTIHGTNDTPVVIADASGPLGSNVHAITELTDENGGITGSTQADTTSGSLAFTDVDLTDTHTVANAMTSAVWSGGTLPSGLSAILADALSTSVATDSTGTGAGSVGFGFSVVDNKFDFLADGETLTVTYDVTVTDNNLVTSTQPVTVTITGTNDTPVVIADASGPLGSNVHAITELTDRTAASPVQPGRHHLRLAGLYRRRPERHPHGRQCSRPSAVWSGGATPPAGLNAALTNALTTSVATDSTGTGAGSVGFGFSVVDNKFDFLADGETLTVTYDVTVTDNNLVTSTQPVTVTITGTNDTPVVIADASGPLGSNVHAITELTGGHRFNQADTTSGSLAFTDVDLNDTHTVRQAPDLGGLAAAAATATERASAILASTFTLELATDSTGTGAGSVSFGFSVVDNKFDFLADGETLTVTYDVTVTDNNLVTSTQTVTVTITGTNDTPVAVADASGALGRTSTRSPSYDRRPPVQPSADTTSGSLSFTDVDLNDTHTVANAMTSVVGRRGTIAERAAPRCRQMLVSTRSPTDSTGTGAGSVGFGFSVVDSTFDFLADGETLTVSYDVTVTDNNLVTSTQTGHGHGHRHQRRRDHHGDRRGLGAPAR